MRAMIRNNGQWQRENPANLSSWLYANDGAEAVVIDDASKTYFCATPQMAETYREAWAKERKVGDKRTAAMFIDLDRQLFAKETPIMPDQSPAYCAAAGCLCSEVGGCLGQCS